MNCTLKKILTLGVIGLMMLTVGCAGKKGRGGGGGGDGPGPGGGGEGPGKNRANNALQQLNDDELVRVREERDELKQKLDEFFSQLNDPLANRNGFTGNGIDPNGFSALPSVAGAPLAGPVIPGGALPDTSLTGGLTGEKSGNGNNIVQVGFLPGTEPNAPSAAALQPSASRVSAASVSRSIASH